MSETADWAAEYDRLREKVALKGGWDRPEELSDTDLAAFARVEPQEHIVGHMYSGGCAVIEGVYAEIARRLVAKGRTRADADLIARCDSLSKKAHASYVFARNGGGIKLDAELETAEDFLDVETIIRDYPRMAGFFNSACPLLVGLLTFGYPTPWKQVLVNREKGDSGEYATFDRIVDATGAVVAEVCTEDTPEPELIGLPDGDYLRRHRHIVQAVNAIAELRELARCVDGPVGRAERIENEKNKERT